MKEKVREKERAIKLRKQGFSYNDILKEVSVSKSSLSMWLKDLPLTNDEKRYLRTRKNSNINRGRIKAASSHRKNRLARERVVYVKAHEEFEQFVKDPLFHTGVALYWAEGAKRNPNFCFSNSDPAMMEVMVKWIEKYLCHPREELTATLYTHRPFENDNLEKFWSKETGIPLPNFNKTIFKPTGRLVKRRPNYKGCLRITTKNGTVNLLKMLFWQSFLSKHYRE